MFSSRILLAGFLSLSTAVIGKQHSCNADDIPVPEYFGTKVTSVTAKEVQGFTDFPMMDLSLLAYKKEPLDFCNVTVTYTHEGSGDSVNVYVWMPLNGWNGNFLGQGGGGWAAGMEGALTGAVSLGYAAANTDTGHSFHIDLLEAAADPASWALSSPGNVNWQLLQNFASISLNDMTHLAKQVVTSFYGQVPKYSYWNGCSTGGRQGMIQAQRYPEDYNGVLAAAPAINWATFLVTEMWAHVLMKKLNYYPPACELDAITKAAIEECDELDGAKDGMIAAHRLCKFDATSIIGQKFDCDGDTRKISKDAATIANAVWNGPERDGKREWHGLGHEASLTGTLTAGVLGGLASTTCEEKNKDCKSRPFAISESWIRYFLKKDPTYDFTTMTEDDFFDLLHMSRQRYTSIVGTDDPDLSAFRSAGGKILTWHGLADELIFPNGSSNYYDRVLALDPKASDFIRLFEAPGIYHCFGGPGAFPGTAFQTLVDWVEKGKAPETLDASTMPTNSSEAVKHRSLCPYPSVQRYKGGDPNEASSFECAATFDDKKAKVPEHGEL